MQELYDFLKLEKPQETKPELHESEEDEYTDFEDEQEKPTESDNLNASDNLNDESSAKHSAKQTQSEAERCYTPSSKRSSKQKQEI